MLNLNRKVIGALATFIQRIFTPKSRFEIEDRDILRSILSNFKGRVLNVGCGEFNKYLGFCPGDTHIGLDIEKTDIVDVIGDAHLLPFKDENFDAVICNMVLEHVENPKDVLKEIYRVVKPGGQCHINVPFLLSYHSRPEDFRRYTKVGLKKEAEAVGFKELEMYSSSGVMKTFEYLLQREIDIHISKRLFKRGIKHFIYFGLLLILSLIFHLLAKFCSSFEKYEEDFSVSYIFVGKKS